VNTPGDIVAPETRGVQEIISNEGQKIRYQLAGHGLAVTHTPGAPTESHR